MTKMKKNFFSIIFISLWITAIIGHTQGVSFSSLDTIPLDPALKCKTLNNGFKYCTREASQPSKQVSIILVVKAGANQETKSQQQLAHFLEHLPFTGTKNFKDPFNYFEKLGVKRGSGLNATTGDAYTLYYFNLPNNNTNLINKALLFLRDCGDEIVLDKEKIEKEKGIILRETGEPNPFKIEVTKSNIDSLLKADSTLDTRWNLKHFSFESLSNFYASWYRPPLQGLFIVGDFNVKKVEKGINKIFSQMKERTSKINHSQKIDSNAQVFETFSKTTDVNSSDVTLRMSFLSYNPQPVVWKDYEKEIAGSLYNIVMNSRLKKYINSYDPLCETFNSTFHERLSEFGRNTNVVMNFIRVKNHSLKTAYITILSEIERVKLYGFQTQELELAKTELLFEIKKQDRSDFQSLARSYADHFIFNTVAPDPKQKRNTLEIILRDFSNDKIRELCRNFFVSEPIFNIVGNPNNPNFGIELNDINRWNNEIDRNLIEPFADLSPTEPNLTMTKIPHAPNRYNKVNLQDAGITMLKLQNNITILLKKIPQQPGGILIKAINNRGASTSKKEDYFNITLSASMVGSSGLAGMNHFNFQDYLTKNEIRITPFITSTSEGVNAYCKDSDNLELVMKLVYLYFTAPSIDSSAFRYFVSTSRQFLTSHQLTPNELLIKQIDSTMNTLYNLNDPPLDLEALSRLDTSKMRKFYIERFSAVDDFTFILTGNFDTDEVIPIITSYIGALPNKGKSAKPLTNKINLSKWNSKTLIVRSKGTQDSQVHIRFLYECNSDHRTLITCEYIQYAFQSLLSNRLRNETGGVYSVNVGLSGGSLKHGIADFEISFSCASENLSQMLSAVDQVVSDVGQNGITIDLYKAAQNLLAQEYKARMRSPAWWLEAISLSLFDTPALNSLPQSYSYLLDLSHETLNTELKKYFTNPIMLRFILDTSKSRL